MIPRVSVVMAVRDGASYLESSLRSILGQSLRELECIVVDDGSADATPAILRRLARDDDRLRVVSRENKGLAASLNEACALARAPYLARMDADDISLPRRLERQAALLDKRPEVAICGSFAVTFGAFPWRPVLLPTKDAAIRCELLFTNPLLHPAIMMRREVPERLGGYDPAVTYAQDYDLWARALPLFSFANYPSILLCYRRHRGQMGNVYADAVQKSENEHVFAYLLGQLDLTPTPMQLDLHFQISRCASFFPVPPKSSEFLSRAEAWLQRLRCANHARRLFPEPHFTRMLSKYWLAACRSCHGLGGVTARTYAASSLSPGGADSLAARAWFAVDGLVRHWLIPTIPLTAVRSLTRRLKGKAA